MEPCRFDFEAESEGFVTLFNLTFWVVLVVFLIVLLYAGDIDVGAMLVRMMVK